MHSVASITAETSAAFRPAGNPALAAGLTVAVVSMGAVVFMEAVAVPMAVVVDTGDRA